MKVPFCTTEPLTLFVFDTVKSGSLYTVSLSVLDVTPLALAVAVFVTEPVVTSPATTV